jgi:U3 small nucleolar RNA-associated protein 10
VLLKRFADKQVVMSDGVPAKHAAQALLAAVEGLMAPLPFLLAVAQLFDSDDMHVQRRALRLFLTRLRAASAASLAASAEHAALIEPLATLVRRTDKAATTSRCAGLTVLGALVERFGQSPEFAAKLLPVMPDVLQAARHKKTQVASCGLECIAAAVQALSTRLVPLLPTVMPAIMGVLEADDADAVRLCAALGAVKAVAERVDSFLSPFAHQLVHLLLSPRFVANASAEVVQGAASARTSVAQRIPARILLEPLTSTWEASLDAGLDCAAALLDQVKVLVEAMDADAVALHHDTIFGAS